MSSESRNCQNCKNEFLIEPEDFSFYEKISVPAPTWCPECRMIRRFAHRNERNLYRVRDARTGKEIFSGIPPQAPVKIYDHDYWWSDGWDPLEYGREYDFSRPFFEQFKELMRDVPFPSRNITNLVNSDYSDQSGDLKNCYLCFNIGGGEDSGYIVNGNKIKNSYDLLDASEVELSYYSLSISGCYRTFLSLYCEGCMNVWFCRDCIGCSDCFGCVNLRNKKYHIFNKPYTKENYFEELKKFNLDSHSGLISARKAVDSFWVNQPRKFIHGHQNVNVSGDCINFSKNVKFSFGVEGGENLKYCQEIYRQKGYWEGGKDSYDYYNWGYGSELMYETCGSGQGCKNVKFCLDCWPAVQDIEYCIRCISSNNSFGCVGLKKKSYCILNKQYSKEEYFPLREKIIKQMNEMPYVSQGANGPLRPRSEASKEQIAYKYGEFFPIEFSLFAYNETVANDYFPLTKEEAGSKGFQWREIERKEYQTTMDSSNLPDKICETNDSILKEIIRCSSCKKAYRVIASEFQFLRSQNIPLPRLCVNCRHLRRLSYRNKPRFYGRKCACNGINSDNGLYANQVSHSHGKEHCPNEFITSYQPGRSEIVYCEQCYNNEVV